MTNDLLQVASSAANLSEYIERNGGSPDWGRAEWLIVEAQAKLTVDLVRVAHGGKLPSEIQQETLATGR